MKKYDYLENMKTDIFQYIEDNIEYKNFNSIEDLQDHLIEVLYCEDSVTGNASGSYTFNSTIAEENLCGNLELLVEALIHFDSSLEYIKEQGPEACDVTIRCYLLPQAIYEVTEEIKDDFEKEVSQ